VNKRVCGVEHQESLTLGMFACMLQGTNIAAGKCRGIVVGTGLNTEIGQ